jgi:X-X-X-Leu-X-X-Gly heptad repeat protein
MPHSRQVWRMRWPRSSVSWVRVVVVGVVDFFLVRGRRPRVSFGRGGGKAVVEGEGEAVSWAGKAVSGVGDAVSGVGDAVSGVGDAVSGDGNRETLEAASTWTIRSPSTVMRRCLRL